MPPRHIAFYGRKGVGTTTVVANISAALAEAGHKVVQIGCDGGSDSTATLRRCKKVPTLTATLQRASTARLADVAVTGFKGILCLEVGQSESKGELKEALVLAGEILAAEAAAVEFVLYDIAGEPAEVVAPLLESVSIESLFAVGTADAVSLRAVNELFSYLGGTAASQPLLSGIIGNLLPGPYAEAVIDDFARKTAVPVVAYIPRSLVVTRSEFFGETVIDAAPLAHQAYLYRKLARDVAASRSAPVVPLPLDNEGFRDWSLDWGERLFDLDEGLVYGGAAI
jgi:nitrogenase iron protein NifH